MPTDKPLSERISWPVFNAKIGWMLADRGEKKVEGTRAPIIKGAQEMRVMVLHKHAIETYQTFSVDDLRRAGVLKE